MTAEQRRLVFYVANSVMVLLAILGVLYLTGTIIATGPHDRRAQVCFLVAAAAAIVAFATRTTDRR